MAKQTINVGSSANDGTGDKIRVAFQKTNANFTELYDGKIDSVVAGTNVTVDNTDPLNPIVSATGGGSQTLEQTLVLGNTTGGENISISDGDAVILDNGANLKKGTTNAGLGGAKGIALRCAVDYELKWEAGRLYVMEENGFTIRETKYNFAITPTATDDETKGFIVGSRWILDNGDVYVCTDDGVDGAIWELQSNGDGVPYTGATQDVNLGEFGLLTGNIEFDNTPTNIPTTAGSMVWNDTDGTVDLKLKGGNVTLQIGQENVIRVVNKTATNINLLEANYQAVRVTGAQGQRLKVDLAQATNDALSAETIGLVTETINDNQEGFITTSGLIRNINTTGSLQSETWADGDILYLSPTVAGRITKVKPVAPNHLVIIGYVVSAHATQGSIFIKVDNGYELDELHNVKIDTPLNNNLLAYTSATDIWENKSISTIVGGTPVTGAGLSDQIAYFPSNGSAIASLDTTTYPSVSELANVKGVTSPIQNQLDTKQYTLFGVNGAFIAFSDSTTYYFSAFGGNGGTLKTVTTGLEFNAPLNNLDRICLQVANQNGVVGTSENVSLYYRNITTSSSTLIGTFQTNIPAGDLKLFNFASINIDIPSGTNWCLEIRTPAWTTNPTTTVFRHTIFLTR